MANLRPDCSRDLIETLQAMIGQAQETGAYACALGSMRVELDPLNVDVTKPIYSAAMLAQHVIALQTELHRPKPL
jgi:hypothetical protein